MNGDLCSKCKTNESLRYHAYCKACHRAAAGRPAVPKFTRDPNNTTLCSKCKSAPRSESHRYCVPCRRKAQTDSINRRGGSWAAKSSEQKHKSIVRSYIRNLVKRGKILKQPCAVCGDVNSQIHHLDYLPKTLNVAWLCFTHHKEAHKNKRTDLPMIQIPWMPDPRRKPIDERLAMNSIVSDDQCWLWQGYCEGEHGRIGIDGKIRTVHQVAWEIFHGPIPSDKWVLHKCTGHGNCWNPAHLYLGDPLKNAQDRVEQGRDAVRTGERNGRAILTIEQIAWIRQHYEPHSRKGMSTVRIAKILGVSQSAVWFVVSGWTWKEKPAIDTSEKVA